MKKADSRHTAIAEIYEIAADLTISGDKTIKGYGQRLRKLIEQVEMELARKTESKG